MKLKLFRDLVIVVLVILGIAFYQSRGLPDKLELPLSGVDLDGKLVNLRDYRAPVLIHFWATWCPICSLEEGGIESLSQDFSVLSVAILSGGSDEIRQHMTDNELSFTTIVDEDGVRANQWGVEGVPATFIVDADGVIQYASQGYSTELGLRFWLWWYGV